MSGALMSRSVGEPPPTIYEASQTIRSLILFVLLFAAYLFTVFWSTTDLMLLKEAEIILPIIHVGVPIVKFYVVAPALFLYLHVILLIKLRWLAREICEPSTLAEPKKPSGLYAGTVNVLLPIYPVRLMQGLGEAPLKRPIFSVIFFILVGVIPPFVVLLLQARFLAFQDVWITFFHQAIVTADLFFQFLFLLSYNRLWRVKKRPRTWTYLIGSVLIAILFLYAWTIALVPNSYIENKVETDLQQSIAGCFFLDWWKDLEDFPSWCNFVQGKRHIDVEDENITLREVPPAIVGALIQRESTPTPTPTIPCQYHFEKLDLSDRRLHYADFRNSTIQCAKMVRTQLKGANLDYADLVDADLNEAVLSSATLVAANLSSADLSYANLSGAKLTVADLSDADLSDANLSGADLTYVDLSGADLSYVDLSGVELANADLFGADLNYANLSGADLSDVDLSGTDLSFAKLYGADLSEANLSGADLSYAKLYGAILDGTKLYKTDLSNTYLYGADLSGAKLRNVNLRFVSRITPDEVKWNDILENIRQGSKKRGFFENRIVAQLARIEAKGASPPGFVLPSPPPPAVNCVFFPNTPPYADWELSEECADPLRE